MRKEWEQIFEPFIGSTGLCLGCGMYPEPSTEKTKWTSLDMNPTGPADVIYNLNNVEARWRGGDGTIRGINHGMAPSNWYEDQGALNYFFNGNAGWLPFMDESFDTVLASHVLEHIEPANLISVFFDVARILKPGGHFIIVVPHGASDCAWDDPHHRQRFTPNTFAYFDKRLYDQESASLNAGQMYRYAIWSRVFLSATPSKQWMGKSDDEVDKAQTLYRNVLDEIQIVLRKESL